jgi:hypothetical protein
MIYKWIKFLEWPHSVRMNAAKFRNIGLIFWCISISFVVETN